MAGWALIQPAKLALSGAHAHITRGGDTVSLRIDINTIARLLLQDGMWYEVLPGSFAIDSFDWADSEGIIVESGSFAGAPTLGARFKVRGMNGWISCPLTSILAVHHEPIEIDDPLPVNIPLALTEEIDPHLP